MTHYRSSACRITAIVLVLLTANQVGHAQTTGTVIVANMSDNTATIFDALDGSVLATVPTGSAPHEIAVSQDGRTAVITNYGVRGAPGNTLTVVNLLTLDIARTVDLGIYERPHGIAFVDGDSLVAITSEVKQVVVIVNVHDGLIARTIPTGQRASHMLAVGSNGRRVFTTNIVDGTVTVIDPIAGHAEKVVEVAPMVEGIASSPDGATLWVGSNARKTVSVVDVESGVVVDSLTGFGFPYRMAVTPDGNTAVLSDPMLGEIRLVSTATRAERARVVVPRDRIVSGTEFSGSPSPEGIAISNDGKVAFVALQGRNEVGVVDLATATIRAFVPAGSWPDGIAYSPLVHR